ncbi:universal stress protein [Ferruginivarius sediminum]|nr:universal stress protein [Ferruginivarius sediminum]
MAYKNLLLHIDNTKACAKRIEAALALATRCGAHLSALYCMGEFQLPGWADMPQHLTREYLSREEERAREVVEDFEEKAKRAGVSYETRTARVPVNAIADEVGMHARYADLAILGQVDPDDTPEGTRDLVEDVTLGCGRPVLVVPYIGAAKENGNVVLGRKVMVAWDAGREATRAVNDALPMLQKAEKVDLLAVNPVKSQRRHGENPGADIALHLARHGVKVEVQHLEVHDIEAGDTILSRLADEGSDLLVMGAYGHSRLRELVLGGATRSVLEHMTVPVIMSH